MKTVASHALGCKVNQYESEAIAELFQQRGYHIVNIEQPADVYIINTCTVTNFGDKKSRQLIRKVKRQNPDSIVVVAGCYAQTAPEEIMEIEGVNIVVGTKNRVQIVELVDNYKKEGQPQNCVTEIMKEREFEPLSIQKLENRTRAYLKIQDGCSQFCSYCIIPYARGPVRSRKPEDVMLEVKRLEENGFQEIVLTGIHVASYGKDLKDITLIEMIEKVHTVEGIKRIRLSSIEPNIITNEFAERLSKLNKVCDHFHLSLQSGCDETLQKMNRKYTTKKYRQAVEILRNYMPSVAITTDIIVGFPAETEQNFLESYEFAKEIGFSKIHVFPYSPKRGTPAAVMSNQISNSIKSERSQKLISLSEEMAELFLCKFIGENRNVLYERQIAQNVYEGHTTNYIKVHTVCDQNITNKIVETTIKDRQGETAIGVVTKL